MIKAIKTYFWPTICGLLFAAVVWFAAPGLISSGATSQNEFQSKGERIYDELNQPLSYASAVQRAAPSVVNIYTSKTVTVYSSPLSNNPAAQSLFNNLGALRPSTQEQKNLGTGVIVSRDGYVMTNEHVIAEADEILVALNDGRTSEAIVVGVDSMTDLAVLKINLGDLNEINIGDPDTASVGDIVLAIGNAQGFQQTVTQGILSAKGRNLVDDMYTFVNVNFLQTDAAINQGNSGGPLVDVRGDMIGINSRTLNKDGSFGLSFAIPADIVLKVFRDILEHGKVIRGWLGFEAVPVTLSADSAAILGIDRALVVRELYPGGPAHRAGLEIDDIITKINGEEFGNIRAASRLVANSAPGSKIDFEVVRGNQTVVLTILVGLQPEAALVTN